MKSRRLVFLFLFCSVLWICGGTVTASELNLNFAYFKEECPEQFESLDLLDSITKEEDGAASLSCIYEGVVSLEDVYSKVTIKYNLKHRLILSSFTLSTASEKDIFTGNFLNNLEEKEYSTVTKLEDNLYFGETLLKGVGKESVSSRKRARIFLTDNSVVLGEHHITFMPMRTIRLDASISEKNENTAVDSFRNELFSRKGIEQRGLEKSKQLASQKEKEINSREEMEGFYLDWELLQTQKELEILERKNLFYWASCLIFDGLGLNVETLSKWGLENPSTSCAFFLYKEVAQAKQLELPKVSVSNFVENYKAKTSYCVNDKVLAIYTGKMENWKTGEFSYKVDDLKICSSKCSAEKNECN